MALLFYGVHFAPIVSDKWVLLFPSFHSKKLTEAYSSRFCRITYVTSCRLYGIVKSHEWCTSRPLPWFYKRWITLHVRVLSTACCPELCWWCSEPSFTVSYFLDSEPDSDPPAGFPGLASDLPCCCGLAGWPSGCGSAWPLSLDARRTLTCYPAVPAPACLVPPLCSQLTLSCTAVAVLLQTPLTPWWNEKSLITYWGPWEQEITQAWHLQT